MCHERHQNYRSRSILLVSVPAFARGGGGMGHSNTVTTSTQNQSTSAGLNKATTTTVSNNTFKNIALHIVFEKDLRVEMEIVKLMNEGRHGTSAGAAGGGLEAGE